VGYHCRHICLPPQKKKNEYAFAQQPKKYTLLKSGQREKKTVKRNDKGRKKRRPISPIFSIFLYPLRHTLGPAL
jgi:hypothetical protein